ncbi:hypothetical protein [Qipengyuania sp. JC766]|uniref:hypothetical protein n=1 Tax=Qipengyuania sp. JC766 TaxID=3232139 RepID=UPI00345A0091
MTGAVPGRRGQPVVALFALIAAWAAVRAAFWQSPFPLQVQDDVFLASTPQKGGEVSSGDRDIPAFDAWQSAEPNTSVQTPHRSVARLENWRRNMVRPFGEDGVYAELRYLPSEKMDTEAITNAPAIRIGGGSAIDGGSAESAPDRYVRSASAKPADYAAKRWSLGAWLFLRDGGNVSQAATLPSYGRSQAGAVLRRRFDLSDRHSTDAYLRATSALNTPRYPEVALGVSGRPVPDIPIRTQVELRVREDGNGAELRPAVLAVTELPPFRLPLNVRGEAYVQAGYVAGDFATGFVDGQVRLERELAQVGGASLRLGGGAWGGAQRDVNIVTAGPTATLEGRVVNVPVRLSLDYRFKVAGNAEPGSGAALTLSTGF